MDVENAALTKLIRKGSRDSKQNDIHNTQLESSWPPSVFAEIIRKNETATAMYQLWLKYLKEVHQDLRHHIETSHSHQPHHEGVMSTPLMSPRNSNRSLKSFLYHTNDLHFKKTFGEYLKKQKADNPKYAAMDARVRTSPEFQGGKGRVIIKSPQDSTVVPEFVAKSPGINSPTTTLEPLQRFFSKPQTPAKTIFCGNTHDSVYQKMRKARMPFIAGASGSLSDRLLYLNINDYSKSQQEQIAILKSCALIQFGHHSLTEVLIAAYRWNLFEKHLKMTPSDYPSHSEMIRDFNKVLADYNLPLINQEMVDNVGRNCRLIEGENRRIKYAKYSQIGTYEKYLQCMQKGVDINEIMKQMKNEMDRSDYEAIAVFAQQNKVELVAGKWTKCVNVQSTKLKSKSWFCSVCTYRRNGMHSKNCAVCGVPPLKDTLELTKENIFSKSLSICDAEDEKQMMMDHDSKTNKTESIDENADQHTNIINKDGCLSFPLCTEINDDTTESEDESSVTGSNNAICCESLQELERLKI